MSDPLRARDEAAVAAYRKHGEQRHLAVLNQDGLPDLVHDLVMEYALRAGGGQAAPYTDRIDAWLEKR